MTMASFAPDLVVEQRARLSLGESDAAIHRMVISALDMYRACGGTVVDVGCGGGALRQTLAHRFAEYVGVDAIRYERFPDDAPFHAVNLDAPVWPIPDESADVVIAIETIEHLENPWAFTRRLAAITRPGGWVVVTTPNQLSALSLLTLVAKHRFSAFPDAQFPVHRTALLEVDLERAVREAGLIPITFAYSRQGRLPFTARHVPRLVSTLLPRAFSDNILLLSRKPAGCGDRHA